MLLAVAVTNLFTKKVATIFGTAFTAFFYCLVYFSEYVNRIRRERSGEHREKLNLRFNDELHGVTKELEHPNRILVAIREPKNMVALQKTLEEMTDDTDIVAFHSKRARAMSLSGEVKSLGPDEELIFTRVIEVAEKAGRTVVPLMVVSNDPAYAIAQAAQAIGATEVVMGASRHGVEAQIERLAMTWGALATGASNPVKLKLYRPGGSRMEITI